MAELARATAPTATRSGWLRLVRLALTGLVAGAAAGFLAALLRPRPWTEYTEPTVASRP